MPAGGGHIRDPGVRKTRGGYWMNTLLLGIITLAAVILVIYSVYLTFRIKKTLATVNQFLASTEETLKPTLHEVQMTLQSIRKKPMMWAR